MVNAAGRGPLADLPGPPPRLVRALNRLTAPRSAPTSVQRVHRWLYDHSDGRVGHSMIGTPTLLLRTTGRRTGRRRCSALAYVCDGDRLIVAASNADAVDRSPAWLHNVLADPSVEVQVGRHHIAGQAAVIPPADPDYQRLWQSMNATNNGRYDAYQAKTSRPIPLVAVTPASIR